MNRPNSAPLVDAVLFDYGGVMTNPVSDSIGQWLDEDGIDPASFSQTLKQWLSRTVHWATPIHRLETGQLAIDEFEALFAAQLRTIDGRPLAASGIVARLFARMQPDEEMFDLVGELRATGIKAGLVSNSWGNTYPRDRIDELFDPVLISGAIGLRKPQPAIYHHALELLDVPAGRVLFVDDAEPNIIGAQAVGVRALLHTSPVCTRAALAALIPDLSPISRGVLA